MSTKKPISISTKTGDKGQTSLANGMRVSKTDPVFEVIGTLDELNSWLGLVVAELGEAFTKQGAFLQEVQDTLFYIGAELAQSPKAALSNKSLTKLEKTAQELQDLLADDWTTKFLLPGGTVVGGHLDIARTVCRRCERHVLGYAQEQHVSETVRKYLNRLSDYLFILRCFVNDQLEYQEKKFKPTYKKNFLSNS